MIPPVAQITIAYFVGLIIVFYAIPVIVRISEAKKFYDVPNERKLNKTIIPNLGGIALFIGITIGTLVGILRHSFPDWRFTSIGMTILFFIGFKDDILVISPRKKFIAQLLVAFVIIMLGDMRITHFHGLLGIDQVNYAMSVLLSTIAIVGTINALNLIDGIDGLAASIGIAASLIFGFIFYFAQDYTYSVFCLATAGSLTAFLYYNVMGKKNKIFMGDTGSLVLGLILCLFAIEFNEIKTTGNEVMDKMPTILSLSILSVPLFDMARLFIARILNKRSPFSPDNNHIHHKFLKLGFNHIESTLIIVSANLLIVGVVYYLREENANTMLMALFAMISTLMITPGLILKYREFDLSKKKIHFSNLFVIYKNSSSEDSPEALREKTIHLKEVTPSEDKNKMASN